MTWRKLTLSGLSQIFCRIFPPLRASAFREKLYTCFNRCIIELQQYSFLLVHACKSAGFAVNWSGLVAGGSRSQMAWHLVFVISALFVDAAPNLAERLIKLGLHERVNGYTAVSAIAEAFRILQTGVVDEQQREQIDAIKAQLTALEDGTPNVIAI